MFRPRIILGGFIALSLMLFLPELALAAPIDVVNVNTKSDEPSLYQSIQNIISLLTWLIGIIAVIMIIIAGIRMTTSAGDVATITSSRKHILSAVVGVVIVISATSIVNYVLEGFDTRENVSQAVASAKSRLSESRSKVLEKRAALEEANASGDTAAQERAQAEYDAALEEYLDANKDVDVVEQEADDAGVKTDSPSKPASPKTPSSGRPADHDTFRVVTFNTRFDVAADVTISDIRRLDDADIIGLQELTSDRKADAIKDKFASCQNCAYDAYMPRGSAAISEYGILWRKDMFKKVNEGSMIAAHGDWSWVNEMRVNWVKLESKATGRSVFVINVHPPSHVEVAGRYRTGVPDRLRAYGLYMDTITNFMQQHTNKNSAVLAVGDFNVDFRYDPQVREANFPYSRMKKIGARSNYQVLGETSLGTHVGADDDGCTENKRNRGSRIIDYVFASDTPGLSFQRHHVVESTCSDHNPVSVLMRWNK